MNSLFRSAPRDKRDRGFESASLQLRVCELSVPLETKSIRDLPRYGPSLRPPTKINARAVAGTGHLCFAGLHRGSIITLAEQSRRSSRFPAQSILPRGAFDGSLPELAKEIVKSDPNGAELLIDSLGLLALQPQAVID